MYNISKSILMNFTNPIIIILLLLIIIYIYFTSTFGYWQNLGVPFKKPTIFIGNYGDLLLFRKSQCDGILEMYNWFKNSSFFGVFRVRLPMFIVRDLNLVKNILVKDFPYFVNRGIPTNATGQLSYHLFNLKDDQWKSLRTKVTPIFSSAKIKKLFYTLTKCQGELDELINNTKLNNSIVDVRDLACKFTADIIGNCVLGIQTDSMTNNKSEFHNAVKRILRPSYKNTLWRMLRASFPKIYNLLRIEFFDTDLTHFFNDIILQIIKQHESKIESKPNDIMDLLIQIKNKKNTMNIDGNDSTFSETDKEIIDFDNNTIASQAFAFLVAGYEPTSNTIAFCLHELALNPEIQEKTRKDIWNAIDNDKGNLTFDTINKMTYLDAVIKETLRKYPPAPMTSRRCQYPYKIPDTNITLPVGMRVVIPIYGIHHDPNYYPNPNQFNPNRFIDPNEMIANPYAFLPFGEGPRGCIGIRFAMLQMKMAIITFLKYKIIISDKTVLPIKLSRRNFTTTSENEFWLKIESI